MNIRGDSIPNAPKGFQSHYAKFLRICQRNILLTIAFFPWGHGASATLCNDWRRVMAAPIRGPQIAGRGTHATLPRFLTHGYLRRASFCRCASGILNCSMARVSAVASSGA